MLCKSRVSIDRLKQLNQLNNSANLCKLNKYSIVKCKTMDNKPNESRNTHPPRTNKQTNDFDTRMYPRALRCLALDLKDYVIFSLSV